MTNSVELERILLRAIRDTILRSFEGGQVRPAFDAPLFNLVLATAVGVKDKAAHAIVAAIQKVLIRSCRRLYSLDHGGLRLPSEALPLERWML